MALLVCGYVAGILAASCLSSLIPAALIAAAGIVAVVLLWCRRLAWVIGILLGLGLATATARNALDHRIAACIDAALVEIAGEVVGLPKTADVQSQFDLAPDVIDPWPRCAGHMPRRLRLAWFEGPRVVPGERWQLRIKLRSVRGYQNPGGFDYEAWSLANHIDGGGSVRYGERRAPAAGWSWDGLRLDLREQFAAAPIRHRGILLALLTGDGGLMDEADWALFRATGTVHLMVISGLHLTIVAVVGVALGRGLSRMSPRLLMRTGSMWPGIGCGAVLVTAYSYLAGWGIPVLRSWLATVVALLLAPLGRRLSLPMVFLWVAAVVLTFDPLAPLQAGFWLSFAAVAILLAQFAPRLERRSALRALLMAQVVLAAAMVPALAATIGSVAWVGPLANLVAVPLISVVVVPIDFVAGVIVAMMGDANVGLLRLVDAIVGFVMTYRRGARRNGSQPCGP